MKRVFVLLLICLVTVSGVSGGSSILIVDSPEGTFQMSKAENDKLKVSFQANIGGTTPSDPFDFTVYYYQGDVCEKGKTEYFVSDFGSYLGVFAVKDWS